MSDDLIPRRTVLEILERHRESWKHTPKRDYSGAVGALEDVERAVRGVLPPGRPPEDSTAAVCGIAPRVHILRRTGDDGEPRFFVRILDRE